MPSWTGYPGVASAAERDERSIIGSPVAPARVIDDIEISGGYPVDETIRRVGQLG